MRPNHHDSSTVQLSIILPCLNEAATLRACIEDAGSGLAALGVTGEIIVADNGSRDDSVAVASRAGAVVVHAPVRGYGAALSAGIAAARGEFVLIADADRSYDLTDLGAFWDRLLSGDQLVIGNRFSGMIRPGAMPILNKWLGNPALTAVGRRLFKVDIGDFHCGIRAGQRDALQELHLQTVGMEYATEMIARAAQAKLRIGQVPTVLSRSQRPRKSHLRPWRDGVRHLGLMVHLRRRSTAQASWTP
jgi:glycosyltransferase involved in cell wall biosynthesis